MLSPDFAVLLMIRPLLERDAIDYAWALVRIGYPQQQPLLNAVTLPVRRMVSRLPLLW